jgi:hypothetical protein
MAAGACLAEACSDTGDNTNVPGSDAGGADRTLDSPGGDVGPPPPVDSPYEAATDAPPPEAGTDGSGEDAQGADAPADVSVDSPGDGPETGLEESGIEAGPEAGPEAGLDGAADGGEDATLEAGADAGQDAGADAGQDAAVEGGQDAAPDVAETGGPLVPCTSAGQTGCVPCSGNTTGVCTPTEARLVQHDIDKGLADAGLNGCYGCMLNNGCIDDDSFGDKKHECGDLSANFDAGSHAGTPESTLCLATLDCVLQKSCAKADISICYCGPTNAGSACATAVANGVCLQPEVDGLGFPATDNTDVLKNYNDITKPSGMANQLFSCAASNSCTACLQ